MHHRGTPNNSAARRGTMWKQRERAQRQSTQDSNSSSLITPGAGTSWYSSFTEVVQQSPPISLKSSSSYLLKSSDIRNIEKKNSVLRAGCIACLSRCHHARKCPKPMRCYLCLTSGQKYNECYLHEFLNQATCLPEQMEVQNHRQFLEQDFFVIMSQQNSSILPLAHMGSSVCVHGIGMTSVFINLINSMLQ